MGNFNQITFFSVLEVVMVSMANYQEAFGEIERFRGWVASEVLREKKDKEDKRVVVGEFEADGRRFEAVVDQFPCQLRLVTEPNEPLLFSWTHRLALGVGEIVPFAGIEFQLGYVPIAYKSDLGRFPEGVINPLLDSVGSFRRNWLAEN